MGFFSFVNVKGKMLPESIPHYSVGPFFGFATNVVVALLCLLNFFLHRHYRPLWNLFLFYLFLAFFFLGWVTYGLQKSPDSILIGYRISQAGLAMLPASWVWFVLSLLGEKPGRLSWAVVGTSIALAILALLGKGPWLFGLPLEIHPSDLEVLRPQSKLLRPLINLFCLGVCLFYVILAGTKLRRLKGQKPVYLLPFSIGLLLWFLGGLHDGLLSYGVTILTHEKILWFASFGLSVSLAIAIALHYRSLERAVREARDVFEKFVPPAYLRRIAAKGLRSIRLGEADQQEVTILCCDIRGFTPLSEKLNPSQLIAFVNRLLERITRAVSGQGGVIDKFIGDAVLCIFEGADSAQRAVACGVDMLSEVKSFNAREDSPIDQPVQIGIGLHVGPVTLGTIGSPERMDSTVLGLTVNLAKRLEEVTKSLGVDMVISNQVVHHLPNGHNHRCRELGEVWVRGGLAPLTLYEVYDQDPPEAKNLKDRIGPMMAEGIRSVRSGRLEAALSKFQEAQSISPKDIPVSLFIKSIKNALGKKEEKTRGPVILDLR
jgi:adenylate cyclase